MMNQLTGLIKDSQIPMIIRLIQLLVVVAFIMSMPTVFTASCQLEPLVQPVPTEPKISQVWTCSRNIDQSIAEYFWSPILTFLGIIAILIIFAQIISLSLTLSQTTPLASIIAKYARIIQGSYYIGSTLLIIVVATNWANLRVVVDYYPQLIAYYGDKFWQSPSTSQAITQIILYFVVSIVIWVALNTCKRRVTRTIQTEL